MEEKRLYKIKLTYESIYHILDMVLGVNSNGSIRNIYTEDDREIVNFIIADDELGWQVSEGAEIPQRNMTIDPLGTIIDKLIDIHNTQILEKGE